MTATAHLLVGASIARTIPNPYLAIPLAFVSNFLLDMVPHWDAGTGWRTRPKIYTFIMSGGDVVIGVFLSFLLFRSQVNPLYLLSCIFAATLADWLGSPYVFLGWDFPPFNWFYNIQSKLHSRDGTFWGIISQIIIVLPIVVFALR